MKTGGMNDKSIENVFQKFEKLQNIWHKFIGGSFLSEQFKENYHKMVDEKFKQIDIN